MYKWVTKTVLLTPTDNARIAFLGRLTLKGLRDELRHVTNFGYKRNYKVHTAQATVDAKHIYTVSEPKSHECTLVTTERNLPLLRSVNHDAKVPLTDFEFVRVKGQSSPS